MGALTRANAASLGHGGAQQQKARYATGRAATYGLALCLSVPVDAGYPSGRFSLYGAAVAVAAETDQTAVATPTAFSTPSAVDITPLGYLVSVGVTMGGAHRAGMNDPVERARKDAVLSLNGHLMSDDTAGLSELISALSASAGVSGANMTLSVAFEAAGEVDDAMGDNSHAKVILIEGRGRAQLQSDIITNGAAVFGNSAVNFSTDVLKTAPDASTGHWINLGPKIAVVVEANNDALDVVSGDKVGCCFLPVTGALRAFGLTPSDAQAADEVMPAFGLAYYANAMTGLDRILASAQIERENTSVGEVVTAYRTYGGAASIYADSRAHVAVGTVNAAAAAKILYVDN